MIMVAYKSKRELKKAIGKPLKWYGANLDPGNGEPFFVTNGDKTFIATVYIQDGLVNAVR